jgi:hypothetical protein
VQRPEQGRIGAPPPHDLRAYEGRVKCADEQGRDPGWRGRVISYVCYNRAIVFDRIALLSSGSTRLWELRDGQHTDITDETVLKLQVDLASMDRLLKDAGIDPELDGDWPAQPNGEE